LRLFFLAVSFGLVSLQILCSVGLVRSAINVGENCRSSDECRLGYFCTAEQQWPGYDDQACYDCEWDAEFCDPNHMQAAAQVPFSDFEISSYTYDGNPPMPANATWRLSTDGTLMRCNHLGPRSHRLTQCTHSHCNQRKRSFSLTAAVGRLRPPRTQRSNLHATRC
jgi:hypothetical protein